MARFILRFFLKQRILFWRAQPRHMPPPPFRCWEGRRRLHGTMLAFPGPVVAHSGPQPHHKIPCKPAALSPGSAWEYGLSCFAVKEAGKGCQSSEVAVAWWLPA